MTAYRNGELAAAPLLSELAIASGPAAQDWPPLISVGALNPDRSVALFSNGGAWVSCYCPGAILVSTVPMVNAAASPGVVIGQPDGDEKFTPEWRANVDPDAFTGFGTWSGTSFAAPVMAGELLRLIRDDPGLGNVDPGSCAQRVRSALTALDFAL